MFVIWISLVFTSANNATRQDVLQKNWQNIGKKKKQVKSLSFLRKYEPYLKKNSLSTLIPEEFVIFYFSLIRGDGNLWKHIYLEKCNNKLACSHATKVKMLVGKIYSNIFIHTYAIFGAAANIREQKKIQYQYIGQ